MSVGLGCASSSACDHPSINQSIALHILGLAAKQFLPHGAQCCLSKIFQWCVSVLYFYRCTTLGMLIWGSLFAAKKRSQDEPHAGGTNRIRQHAQLGICSAVTGACLRASCLGYSAWEGGFARGRVAKERRKRKSNAHRPRVEASHLGLSRAPY